jgi:hypothetical protein
MKRALVPLLVPLAALLIPLMPPAFGRVPALNVETICKTRAADAKMLHSTPGQSIADCVHDEDAARQQLSALWPSSSAHLRDQCESDARALGTTSYLDILTCLQIGEELKADSQKKTAGK